MKKATKAYYEYVVRDGYEGSIESYLKDNFNYSGRVITRNKKEGYLRLNGKDVYFKEICKGGDIISLCFAGEYPDCDAVDIPIDIIHEDEDVIIINKSPNTVVHPTKSHQQDTLANAIYFHWQKMKHTGKVRFVNRLDMDTSGIVVGAKNKYVHHYIQAQSMENITEKYYYAIVKGVVKNDSGLIDAPIIREEEFGLIRIVREDGDPSQTVYEVVERFKEHTLLKLKLLTGRTHQIRVHLKHIGYPIIGDFLYFPEENPYMSRQALHAASFSFIHPRTGERVTYNAPMPEDMKNAMELMRKEREEE